MVVDVLVDVAADVLVAAGTATVVGAVDSTTSWPGVLGRVDVSAARALHEVAASAASVAARYLAVTESIASLHQLARKPSWVNLSVP